MQILTKISQRKLTNFANQAVYFYLYEFWLHNILTNSIVFMDSELKKVNEDMNVIYYSTEVFYMAKCL